MRGGGWFTSATINLKTGDWCVGAWSDQLLLKKIELGKHKAITNPIPESDFGPRLLPVSVNFEILGASGLRVGDLFKLTNAPTGVANIPFQITEITQNLSENLWVTKVKAQMRRLPEIGET
jgi:hypothetical protein